MVKPTRAEIVKEEAQKPRAKPQAKDSRKFEEAMKESMQRLQQPSIMKQQALSQTATEYAVRHKHREDRGREKGRDKGEEREGKRGEGDRKTDAKIAEQKVVAKHSARDEGRGGRGGRGGEFSQRRGLATRAKAATLKQGPVSLQAQFAAKLAQSVRTPSRALTQQVLNQIVQYVRIGLNSDEEKEIRIDLHERIFKGLKLRVATKGEGKVAVHFTTANDEVRSLFNNRKGDIEKALKRNGIEVAEIVVT